MDFESYPVEAIGIPAIKGEGTWEWLFAANKLYIGCAILSWEEVEELYAKREAIIEEGSIPWAEAEEIYNQIKEFKNETD